MPISKNTKLLLAFSSGLVVVLMCVFGYVLFLKISEPVNTSTNNVRQEKTSIIENEKGSNQVTNEDVNDSKINIKPAKSINTELDPEADNFEPFDVVSIDTSQGSIRVSLYKKGFEHIYTPLKIEWLDENTVVKTKKFNGDDANPDVWALDIVSFEKTNDGAILKLSGTHSYSYEERPIDIQISQNGLLSGNLEVFWKNYVLDKDNIIFVYPNDYYLLDRIKEDGKIYISPKEISYNNFAGGYFEPVEIIVDGDNSLNTFARLMQDLKEKNVSQTKINGKNVTILSGTMPENLPYSAYDVSVILFREEKVGIIANNRFNEQVDFDLEEITKKIAESFSFD